MNKSEKQVIRNTIQNLRGERAGADVRAHLTAPSAKMYLESWVIPALEILLRDGERDLRTAVELTS